MFIYYFSVVHLDILLFWFCIKIYTSSIIVSSINFDDQKINASTHFKISCTAKVFDNPDVIFQYYFLSVLHKLVSLLYFVVPLARQMASHPI